MDLKAEIRNILGKKVGTLRADGLIPAELYGEGIKNLHLTIDGKEFKKLFKEAGESSVVNLVVGKEKRPVLIQDVNRDPLTGSLMHVDFYQVKLDEKIKVHVPLEFIGSAPGVKEKGGLLNKTMLEVEVECLPNDLPHTISVNLESLADINSSIYVKDLKVSSAVKILVDPATVVATITPPLAEEKPVEEAVNLEAVKVETEEKKAQREKEKEEAKTETAEK